MSFPFQQFPTLAEYMTWASDNGITAHTGVFAGTVPIVRFIAKGQKSYILSGLKQEERLGPRTIDALDDRFGVSSPWNSF